MKTFALSLALAVVALLFGCREDVTQPRQIEPVLAVELGNTFDNDSVAIQLDDATLFSGTVTTNFTISAAWLSGPMKTTSGNHTIRVSIINEGVQSVQHVDVRDTTTVVINYDRSSRAISFQRFDRLLMRL